MPQPSRVDHVLGLALGALAIQRATVAPKPLEPPARGRRFSRRRRRAAAKRVPVAH